MIYEERAAPEHLAGVVTRTWFLEAQPLRRFEKILPLPFAHLIVNLSGPYRVHDAGGGSLVVPDAFVSGLQSRFLVIEAPQPIRHVGVELTATGASALARDDAVAVAGTVGPAAVLLPEAADLARRLRELGPAAALEALATVLTAVEPLPRDGVAVAAAELLDQDPHRPVGAVAAAVGVGPEALVARFRRATGTTPKAYAQVVRFHRLVDAAHAGGGEPAWASLAVAAGYYDQPHVIRAFRRFSGWTPTEYYRLVAEFGADAAHFVPLEQLPPQARV